MSHFRQFQRQVVCPARALGAMALMFATTFATYSCVFDPRGSRAQAGTAVVDANGGADMSDAGEHKDISVGYVGDASDASADSSTTGKWECENLSDGASGCCPSVPAPWKGPTLVRMAQSGTDPGLNGQPLVVDAGLMVGLKNADNVCKCGCKSNCANAGFVVSDAGCDVGEAVLQTMAAPGCVALPGTVSITSIRMPFEQCSSTAGSLVAPYVFKAKAYIFKEQTSFCDDGGVRSPNPTVETDFLCLYAEASNVSTSQCPDGLSRITAYNDIGYNPKCKTDKCVCTLNNTTNVCQWEFFLDPNCTNQYSISGQNSKQACYDFNPPLGQLKSAKRKSPESSNNCKSSGTSSLDQDVKGDENSAWVLCCTRNIKGN